MTAKEYLGQVRQLERRILALLDRQSKYHELGAWRARYAGTKGVGAMVALEREIDGRINEYIDRVYEIEAAIDAVEDEQYRDVLKYRYLNGWSWQKIAERTHFSQDWLWHMHARALGQVKLPE